MCLTPVYLKRDVHTIDGYGTDKVPCGKCPACLRKRQQAWAFRLYQEYLQSETSAFITLTYSDETLPVSKNGYPTLNKKDFQLFMKRLRKKSDNKLKYYACGEYGGITDRPHFHAIVFNLPQIYTLDSLRMDKVWTKGATHLGNVTMASIGYTTKYMMKGYFKRLSSLDDRTPEFSLMSKGMGQNFLTPQMIRYYEEKLRPYVTLKGGVKSPLPRYYKDKLYEKWEQNQMAREVRELKASETERDAHSETEAIKAAFRLNQKEQILKRKKL